MFPVLETQLSTCSVDVSSFFRSHRCGDAAAAKNVLKHFAPISVRLSPWQPFNRVVGNQVHLCMDATG